MVKRIGGKQKLPRLFSYGRCSILWRCGVKMLAGIVLGFLSGFVLYMKAEMLFADIGSRQGPSGALLLAFFVGWAVSSYLLVHGVCSGSHVVAPSSLLSAA